MRRPSGASTVEWMITSRERHLAEHEETGEDHPVLPEPDDLAGGRVDVTRVVAVELGRLLRPAERRERPERRAEPGVEHVRIPLRARRTDTRRTRRAAAMRTSGDRRGTSRSGSDDPTTAAARCTSRERARATRSRNGAGSPGGSGRAAREGLRSPAGRARPCDTTTAARRAARCANDSARTCRPSADSSRASRAGRAP